MNGLTARLALDLLGLGPGETLAVTGAAGAVGGYTIQLAKGAGLRVVADAWPKDSEPVRVLGARRVLPPGPEAAAAIPPPPGDGPAPPVQSAGPPQPGPGARADRPPRRRAAPGPGPAGTRRGRTGRPLRRPPATVRRLRCGRGSLRTPRAGDAARPG